MHACWPAPLAHMAALLSQCNPPPLCCSSLPRSSPPLRSHYAPLGCQSVPVLPLRRTRGPVPGYRGPLPVLSAARCTALLFAVEKQCALYMLGGDLVGNFAEKKNSAPPIWTWAHSYPTVCGLNNTTYIAQPSYTHASILFCQNLICLDEKKKITIKFLIIQSQLRPFAAGFIYLFKHIHTL